MNLDTQEMLRVGRARDYVRRIRNKRKKLYAQQYLEFLLKNAATEPERGELSVMGAQAVRISLRELLEEKPVRP